MKVEVMAFYALDSPPVRETYLNVKEINTYGDKVVITYRNNGLVTVDDGYILQAIED